MELVTLHLASLAVTAVVIIIADHDALQYLRGKKELLSTQRIKRLHYSVMIGLILMVLSGLFLFADAWGELINNPAFYVKMCMVLALIAHSFVIGKLMHIATLKPFRDLPRREQAKLFITGAVSGFCWLGAASIGIFWL